MRRCGCSSMRSSFLGWLSTHKLPSWTPPCGQGLIAARSFLRMSVAQGGQRVLSQITENRKVEARKSLILQHTIFTFGLKKATLRQNLAKSTCQLSLMTSFPHGTTAYHHEIAVMAKLFNF